MGIPIGDNPVLGRFVGEPAAAAQNDLQKLVAASVVIETLRNIVSKQDLPIEVAMDARVAIAKAERAFGFPSIAERER